MKQNAITTATKGEEEAWHLVKEIEHQRETERLVAQGKTKEEADKAKKSLARADWWAGQDLLYVELFLSEHYA